MISRRNEKIVPPWTIGIGTGSEMREMIHLCKLDTLLATLFHSLGSQEKNKKLRSNKICLA
jgi:tartrate dehydratase alpha subunit/fumarate hydratase class I-like protein